jgi:hypothetical protein
MVLLLTIPLIGIVLAEAEEVPSILGTVAGFVAFIGVVYVFGVRSRLATFVVGSLVVLAVGGSWLALILRPPHQELAGLWLDAGNWTAALVAFLGAAIDITVRFIRSRLASGSATT